MTVIKSSALIMVKNTIYGVAGGFVAALIASWFLDLNIAIGIGVVLGLIMIYFALIGDNIRVEIDGDSLSFFSKGKLRHQFAISEVKLSAKIKTSRGDSDCDLAVTDKEGKITHIDCSMLGASRFYRLLDALHVTNSEPIAVKTQKADK